MKLGVITAQAEYTDRDDDGAVARLYAFMQRRFDGFQIEKWVDYLN